MNTYNNEIVQKVNELYHDFINEKYDILHSEMFKEESDRWKRNVKQFLTSKNPVVLLDLGTGTGFVPKTIADSLKKHSVFICSDISQKMLNVTKRNIDKNFDCEFKFVKLKRGKIFKLPFGRNSIDVVTINSVIHHIRDTGNLIKEIDRVLKPGGLIFIGHEPNKYFHRNKFLWYNYKVIKILTNPKIFIKSLAKRTHTIKYVKKAYLSYLRRVKKSSDDNQDFCQKVNKILLKNKIIIKPLTLEEIGKIIDIKGTEGLHPDFLFTDYELKYFETYNHLNLNIRNKYYSRIIRRYDNWLKKKYPKEGLTFFIVLRKNRQLGHFGTKLPLNTI